MAEIRIDKDAAQEALRKLAGRAGLIIPGIIVVAGLFTSYFTVPADSEAVILRFGQYNRTAAPGLNFKMPFWFETKEIIPVARTLKMEFGFGTPGSTNNYQTRPKEHQAEQSMITGDKNSALVEWVVQYRISDPEAYLFRVRDPEDTMRDASESVMREVVGDRTVDEVITIGRQSIETDALVKLQDLVDSYGLGLQIDQLQLKNVNPPKPVQPSFNEVNQAQQDRAKQINVAKGLYNKAVPKTEGEADMKISSAEGEKLQRVNEATGDAERFLALFKEYEKAPSITRQRLYLEKIKDVLPKLKSKIIMDGEASKPLPLLDLNNALNGKGGAR
ncbi:MAG: membrane protease subunit HflK [Akkermansiaceae bacterium]|jgi:membrane protease subunit HflK|tara:strand:- start:6595 stop:7590 length:996 start_codon:yes stop_codon:yes gene_type:complete